MAQRKYNYRDCLIAESPQITVKRVLGNTKADILQKILYWTNHTKESKITITEDKFGIERRWIYHSAKQFENELQLDWTTIRDHLQDMEKDFVKYTGSQRYPDKEPVPYLFSGQFLKFRGYNVKFYCVDKDVLWDYISKWLPMNKQDWMDQLGALEQELQKIEMKAKKEKWPQEAIDYETSELRQKIKYWKPLVNRCKRVPTEEKIEEINTNLAMYYQQYFPQQEQEEQENTNNNEKGVSEDQEVLSQTDEISSDTQEFQEEQVRISSPIERLNKLREEFSEVEDFTEEEKEAIRNAEEKSNNTQSNQQDKPF